MSQKDKFRCYLVERKLTLLNQTVTKTSATAFISPAPRMEKALDKTPTTKQFLCALKYKVTRWSNFPFDISSTLFAQRII